jgi:hypothetical protein
MCCVNTLGRMEVIQPSGKVLVVQVMVRVRKSDASGR